VQPTVAWRDPQWLLPAQEATVVDAIAHFEALSNTTPAFCCQAGWT
jgi:hypothetical protein